MEIMLAVIIIGVLAAMIVPRFAGRTEQAKVARAKADIAAIGLALDLYELDIGKYPADLKELLPVDPPSGVSKEVWHGPYLKKGLPEDPWVHPYEYKPPQGQNKDYELFSFGPDGKPGGDDITSK